MRRSEGSNRLARELAGVPWLTKEGYLDPGKFPMEGLLGQALARGEGGFRAACGMLGLMCKAGRPEAGVYLLGLLRHYQDDLERLAVVVENLALYRTPAAAEALLGEFRRVKSDNRTRRYLEEVLKTLSRFPVELVEPGLEALAEDRSFSFKMRRKFRDLLEDLTWGPAGGP
jgi:hypothetical protein